MTMQIRSSELIAGYPALRVRLLLRHIQLHDAVTTKFIARVMDLDDEQARRFCRELAELGFLEKLSPEEQRKLGKSYRTRFTWYRHTRHGASLAFASAAGQIKRSTAERLIKDFMERVQQVNQSETFCYRVAVVLLFGSILSGRQFLGDVDIAIHLTPRLDDQKLFNALTQAKIREALDRGKVFRNTTEEFFWPKNEIQMFLRARKRSLSIHSVSELATMAQERPMPYRVLLGDRALIREALGSNAIEV